MALGSYTVNALAATYSAAPKTMIQILPPAGHAIDILEASVGQQAYLTSSMGSVQIINYGTSGTTTAFLPIVLNAGGTASACVSGASSTGINLSAEGTVSITIMVAEDFNTLSSWRYEPVPERRPRITPTLFVGLRWSVAPAASLTVDAMVQYYELM